jgi:serine O-acetyltransferase
MKLKQYLIADLARLYSLQGLEIAPNVFDLIKACFNPRFMPILLCRLARKCYMSKLLRCAKVISWLNFFMFSIEITARVNIGKGIFFPHTSGSVIGAAEIGENVTIFQNVTLGAKEADMQFNLHLRPLIGNNVVIGAGAKILGGVKVGNGAIIGANAVVTKDVPEDCLAVGIPAVAMRKKRE